MTDTKNEGEPVKQFYNRKTGKWHVMCKTGNPANPVQVKYTKSEAVPGVAIVGEYSPDNSQPAHDSLSKPKHNEKPESDNSIITDEGETGENPGEKESDNNGFFNFF